MRLKYYNYCVSRGIQKIKTRTAIVLSTFALAVSGGLGVVAIGLGNASAAPGVSYTNVLFTNLSLIPDRQAPSVTPIITPSLLTMGIDNTKANTSGDGFFQTEGLQGRIPASQSIRAELYVEPAWAGNQVRAGLWGIAKSNTAADTAWPIIEYTTVGANSFTGWRVFDTMNGGWTNLQNVTAVSGQWYNLEIAFNPLTLHYDYYVKDKFVRSLPASSGADVYGKLTGVIFNNKNFATGSHTNDYSVQWRNFQTGLRLTDKNQCKNGGWNNTTFKNQGDCVSYFATTFKNQLIDN
jgi:hypothetical protein